MKSSRRQPDLRRVSRGRKAFTLIELLVVIALAGLLFNLVITFAQALMRWDRQFHSRELHSDQLARLAEDIRGELRGATEVSRPTGDRLVITMADARTIHYELTADSCRRSVESAGTAGRGADLFSIGDAAAWEVEQMPAGRRPLVSVTLRWSDAADAASGRAPLVVFAALGADRGTGAAEQ